MIKAKGEGYADCIYLDSKSDEYLEEVSSCNIFIVKGKVIKTAPITGTILDGNLNLLYFLKLNKKGVTRKSVIEIARANGYKVLEDKISINEALDVIFKIFIF